MEEEINNSELLITQETTQPTIKTPAPEQEETETQKHEEKKVYEVDLRKVGLSGVDLSKMSREELQGKIKHCEWGLELFEEERLAQEGGLFNMLKSILLSIKNYNFCGTPKLELFMFESEEGLRYKLEQYKAELKRRE